MMIGDLNYRIISNIGINRDLNVYGPLISVRVMFKLGAVK